jgi:hypothetical protein
VKVGSEIPHEGICAVAKKYVKVLLTSIEFGRVPYGPGYTLQVLAIRASWLRAFHCYPSRASFAKASESKEKGFVRQPLVPKQSLGLN